MHIVNVYYESIYMYNYYVFLNKNFYLSFSL